jgi:hypothetical protein
MKDKINNFCVATYDPIDAAIFLYINVIILKFEPFARL